MRPIIIIICFLAYVSLLFWIAYRSERLSRTGRSLVNNPFIYALSLAVYCTGWTYFGSIGKASESGFGYLPIYLGPTLLAPLWWFVLRKMILISKNQRITSIADFLSSRYGRSVTIGITATIIAVFSIIPYISIQLKAVALSYEILTTHSPKGIQSSLENVSLFQDPAMFIALALAIFTIFFGTRKLEANERHEGLVAAVAFESLLKLLAFLLVGVFVTYWMFNGLGDLFKQGSEVPEIRRLFSLESSGHNNWTWFWLMLLSSFAILLLPRQFHVAVVENANTNHVKKAAWAFPLYLLLINIFVLPIAVAGLLYFPGGVADPDTFILSLPLSQNADILSLFVALGGFSAATSMVIVAVIALSIMINNNLVLPLLLRNPSGRGVARDDLSKRLLGIRRVCIVFVLLFAYGYFKFVGLGYTLVSIGLISFAGVAQFAPALIGGLYWKGATKKGALWGLIVGFLVWAYTLPLPTLAETGILSSHFVEQGLFGLEWLKPYALFGLDGLDHVSHGAFWSLFFNLTAFYLVSLFSRQSALEIAQADLFVNIHKYRKGGLDYEIIRREGNIAELIGMLHQFLGRKRAKKLLREYEKRNKLQLDKISKADEGFVKFVETHLSGAIGSATARTIIRSAVKEDPISLAEMLQLLEQTQEIFRYSQALEKKSAELEATTSQLKIANNQLKELDRLKADFITTVTHELRTPITSIKSLANILRDNPNLESEKQAEFLEIMVNESDRISRLVNQVLDLEKLQSYKGEFQIEKLELGALCKLAFNSARPYLKKEQLEGKLSLPENPVYIEGDADRLIQVMINLLSNAAKFSSSESQQVELKLHTRNHEAVIQVIDQGIGIEKNDLDSIFDRFSQVSNHQKGKPKGTGLGLPISLEIIRKHKGDITVNSQPGKGSVFRITLPLKGDKK
ncbi:MAG: histidine kinase [Bacteroidetes bacterium]|nr:histidine kinase [Bacteroidota bacterium]